MGDFFQLLWSSHNILTLFKWILKGDIFLNKSFYQFTVRWISRVRKQILFPKIKGHIPFRRSQCTFTTWAFSKTQTSNWQKISQRMSGEESFSQILHLSPTLQIFQNGTLNQVHEIWKKKWPKVFFLSIMKMPIRKNIHNMHQVPPNPGFMQEKVQKGDFLKKDSRELLFFLVLGSYESPEGLEH